MVYDVTVRDNGDGHTFDGYIDIVDEEKWDAVVKKLGNSVRIWRVKAVNFEGAHIVPQDRFEDWLDDSEYYKN